MGFLYTGHHVLPTSIYQKRLWLEWQKKPNSSAYNLSSVYKFTGNLNKDFLKLVCNLFIEKNEILYAKFGDDGECSYYGNYSIDDFYSEIMLEHDKEITALITQLINKPFSLTESPLLRLYLLSGSNKNYFIINAQHSIVDGISLKIISKRISEIYTYLTTNKLVSLNDTYSFSNCIEVEKKQLSARNTQETSDFWQDFLKEIPLSTKLSVSNGALLPSAESNTIYFRATTKQTEAIKNIASQSDATIFIVLFSLYALHLSKYVNQQQFLISYPVNMRPQGYAEMLGCFTNNLPLKIKLNDEHRNLSDLVKDISKQRYEISSHSWYSLTNIIQDLRETRGQLEPDILNIGFAATNLNVEPVKFQGVCTENLEMPWSNEAIYHLCLQYDASLENTICFKLEHQKNKLDSNIANSFVDSFQMLLQKITGGDFPLKEYSPLSNDEKNKIFYTWNHSKVFPSNRTLNELFEDQVKKSKHDVALLYGDMQVSYSELNRRTNQLARYIRLKYTEVTQKTLQAGDYIVLYLDRSIDQALAILAVLKAGAAYVPISISHPEDRVRHIIEDTNARIILTQAVYLEALKDTLKDQLGNLSSIGYLTIDEDNYSEQDNENLPVYNQASDIAYVIYTSGTTGRPKGVLQPHANVMRLFTSTEKEFNFSKNDVWALYHSYAFDFSVWEMWGALIYGGKLIIPTQLQVINIPEFYALCLRHKITILNQTPTAFYQFLQIAINEKHHTLTNLRYIIFGGESLKMSNLLPWWKFHKDKALRVELINMYGITETTVHVTLKRLVPSDNETVCNIGRPLEDLFVFILNEKLDPVPIGIVGELYIGGAGLATGYLNRPELTQERFIDNPFSKKSNASPSRLYKTGDLVRYLPNGELEYLGRNDKQIKIRGYRIEMGEIESTLASFLELGQCHLLSEEMNGDKVLACYYTGVLSKDSLEHVKKKMRFLLPEYMLPNYWHAVQKFPLTVNGKIDSAKLKAQFLKRERIISMQAETALQEKIFSIWQEILPASEITLDDNFFDVGGNSIKVLSLYALLKVKLGLKDSQLVDLFKHSSIRKYAAFVSETNLDFLRKLESQ